MPKTNKVSKPKELKVTSAKDWKKVNKVGQLVELPSGRVAKLVRPHLLALIKEGVIPDAISAQVSEMFTKKVTSISKAIQTNTMSNEDGEILANILCKAAFVEPKISDNPGPDELSVDDIDPEDKIFVTWWSQGGATDLKVFRKQQARVLEIIHNSNKVSSETK